MELVQLGEGTEVTRRRVDWDRLRAIADSAEQLDRVIGLLAGAQQRLIIVDENTVEVAHEALLCRWKLLSDWIEEDQENIRISRRLEVACREWEETYRKSDDALLTGARLAEVEEWEKRVLPNLTGDEREFLGKSVGRRDREVQQQINRLEKEIQLTDEKLKAQKQRTRLAIASGILLTFTLGLGLRANVLQGEKREQEASTIGALIGKAEQLLKSKDQLKALSASVEALKEMKKKGRKNPTELQRIQLVIDKVQERNRLESHTSGVYAVSFSPDGKIIASGDAEGKIILWSSEGKIIPTPILKHEGAIWSIRFSHNGLFFASASFDKTVKIWDKSGKLLHTLKHEDQVYDLSFSKDGNRIASAGKNGNIIIWDIKNEQPWKILRDKNSLNQKNYEILGVDFSPVNQSILISTGGSKDYDINIWDLQKKEDNNPRRIGNNSNKKNVMSVRFNRTGNKIVSSDTKGIKIWDSNGYLIGVINDTGKTETLYADFSSDSQFIGSATMDGIIKIWSLGETLKKKPNQELRKQIPEEIKGHNGTVYEISFNPNQLKSRYIASGSDDKTVRIWEIGKVSLSKHESPKLDNLIDQSCKLIQDYIKKDKISESKDMLCNNS